MNAFVFDCDHMRRTVCVQTFWGKCVDYKINKSPRHKMNAVEENGQQFDWIQLNQNTNHMNKHLF